MRPQLDQQRIDGRDPALVDALHGAHLPTDDLSEDGRAFYRFTEDGQIVGFGGLERCDDDALLRSIVVPAQHRSQGYGQAITSRLLDQAQADGVRAIYLLPQTAAPFFEAAGFRTIGRDAASAAVLATRQAASLCPASATLMVRNLSA